MLTTYQNKGSWQANLQKWGMPEVFADTSKCDHSVSEDWQENGTVIYRCTKCGNSIECVPPRKDSDHETQQGIRDETDRR